MNFIRHFHSSPLVNSRFPALKPVVTRRARIRHNRKHAALQLKLGSKYRPLNRLPPLFPPPVQEPNMHLAPFLANPENKQPPPIRPGDLKTTLLTKLDSNVVKKGDQKSINISRMTSTEVDAVVVKRGLIKGKIPREKGKPFKLAPKTFKPKAYPPEPQAKGPYLAHNITQAEANRVLETLASKIPVESEADTTPVEQANQVARIISLDNASAPNLDAFNRARLVGLFGKHAMDTGSSAVQAALFTLKINSIKKHLEKNKKDISTKRSLFKWESKRVKILKYLKRKVCVLLMAIEYRRVCNCVSGIGD